jgi:NAD(P)-dependent dehydrogenase (short-subunit alcohol dehydrogenase family)
MGFALASKLVKRGDRVLIRGRDPLKLERACERLGVGAIAKAVDTTDQASLQAFFECADSLSGIFYRVRRIRRARFVKAIERQSREFSRRSFGGGIGLCIRPFRSSDRMLPSC